MHVAIPILLLAATVVVVATACRRVGLSAPLVLTALGAAASYLPWVPMPFAVEPEVILLGFLPPLLFAAASQTSLIDLNHNRQQILSLSVFLVLLTALGVGLVTWLLLHGWLGLDVTFPAALALGGVVAPPDAVAATAVARRIGLPRRVVTILEGESLFNDATALVTVRTSIALVAGGATVLTASRDFLIAAVGGAVVGLVAFKVIAWVRTHVTEPVTDVAISFLSPWLAYLPAEAVSAGGAHGSGVIAVVVCGVLLAHEAPTIQTAQSRVSERMNWSTIQFLLENMVFLLIGLQTHTIVDAVVKDENIGLVNALLVGLAVLVTVIVLRPLFVMPLALLWKLPVSRADPLSMREAAIISWAGMRGVVTLAAAFLLPADFAQREALVLIALIVAVGTLIVHGFSLGWLARRLDLHGPDPREDALQSAQVTQAAVRAGRAELDRVLDDPDTPTVPEDIEQALRTQAERRANIAWERLGGGRDDSEAPTEAYRRLRTAMLQAERTKVLKMRDAGHLDHAVLRAVMDSLDVEESMIAAVGERQQSLDDRMLLTPEERQGGCEDLRDASSSVNPETFDECPDCIREGTTWVHLRLCLTCGHVGCCDSSVARHATRHYEESAHPVMRSFEPGEAWRWCFKHELLG
ncbi:cation:proton antiporter [Luteipulveratus sp. YIM 133132]|uniref:cation:proton antiporter domain-containing protein n=1 Tax=Luteipulveratus flavus TaxID=3031728 RepID=UPI0023AFEDC4|nr:cation:proton antiporter [Luteipulveratus sp. YIM 133132]MDE9367017.1 cation:proton antiporter [Luteipulveratus sp. YIM 133132]